MSIDLKLSNADLMEAHIGAFDIRNVRRVDLALTVLTAALISFGLLVLLSATHSGSVQTGSLTKQVFRLMMSGNFVKQVVGIGAGSVLALLVISLDYRSIVAWAPVLYGFAIVLLVLVLLIGTEAKGGKRWIDIGPVNFQPSEFTKIALIYMMAWYFTLIGPRIKKLPYFLLSFAIPALPAVLILKQPNLGTTMTLFPIMFVMLFVAGCRFWHIAALVIVGLIAAPVAFSQLKDYQKERVLSFIVGSPEAEDEAADGKGEVHKERVLSMLGASKKADAEDRDAKEKAKASGYHTLQTVITVGSGQMHGKGYLKGTQTHLSFLPEHHTDFIFAVLAEEKGFVGAICGVGLLAVFFLRGFGLARECPEMSGTLLAVGCVTLLAFHSFVNIAITIGLLPVTGIPLPFFSYGPSFYLTTMMCVGTLLSVHARRGYFD